MVPSFLVMLREGLEAALIVGIMLAYLKRTGHGRKAGVIWMGVYLAGLVSVLAAAVIFVTAGQLEGRAEALFEGTAMLVAAGMLTYMLFWMRRQAARLRTSLQAQVQTALQSGSLPALGLLAFVAVGREGIEAALFMFATARTATPLSSAAGGALGLGAAIALGYVLYRGTRRTNLRAFFTLTGVFLLLFAAGLLAHAVHEYAEAGVISPIVAPVWDINWLLDERSTGGSFLRALFGYNGDPSLAEVLVYVAYLATAGFWYLRPPVPREPSTGAEAVPA